MTALRDGCRRTTLAGLALLTGVALASPAAAQVAWDAPFLVPPRAPAGWGAVLLDPAGGDLGLVGTWRGGTGSWGLRGGFAEQHDDDLALLAGADLSGALVRGDSDVPVDVDWIVGGGLSVGDEILISVPFGVTVGASISAESVALGPYLSPRLVLDLWTGDDEGPGNDDDDDEGLDLDVAVDIGIDIAFDPGWTIRFGGTLGDREALAIGFMIH
jgi:hypothetical protein